MGPRIRWQRFIRVEASACGRPSALQAAPVDEMSENSLDQILRVTREWR